MTAIRMMKATKSTAPKDAATIITEGEELLLLISPWKGWRQLMKILDLMH